MSTTTTTTTMSNMASPSSTTATAMLPTIILSGATPSKTSPPKRTAGTPRLLYRGALALPDSYIQLDGLTFIMDILPHDPQATIKLLETPLALALESMRGRPSLSFVGVEKMADVHCDFAGGVRAYVHPKCILTCQLFAHNICSKPIPESIGRSEYGIRIRLGDTDNLVVSNDIIVYGSPHPSSSTMQLCVARIVLHPVSHTTNPTLRPPRPDEPAPRLPPLMLAKVNIGVKRPHDKGKGKEKDDDKTVHIGSARKKAKKVTVGDVMPNQQGGTTKPFSSHSRSDSKASFILNPMMLPKELGRRSRVRPKNSEDTFKIPALPSLKATGAAVSGNGDDVFLVPTDEASQQDNDDITDLETTNKTFVKRISVRLLASSGVTKQHPEFKDVYGYVYRGTSFALRCKMKNTDLEANEKLVERIVEAHVKLYLRGDGEEVLTEPP